MRTFDDATAWKWTAAVEGAQQDVGNLMPWELKWNEGVAVNKCPLPVRIRGYHGTFFDKEFPPEARSCGKPGQEGFPEVELEWVRGPNLQSSVGEPAKLYACVEPGDVMQGALGDCWLLAAISAVAEFPGYFESHIFREKKISSDGKYTVMLYDLEADKRVPIVIDDFIPCTKRDWWEATSCPYYAQPKGNELYILCCNKVKVC